MRADERGAGADLAAAEVRERLEHARGPLGLVDRGVVLVEAAECGTVGDLQALEAVAEALHLELRLGDDVAEGIGAGLEDHAARVGELLVPEVELARVGFARLDALEEAIALLED